MKVYVFFANGFEEIEALTTVDILRRANLDVKMVSILNELTVTGAHNIKVTCDELFSVVKKAPLPDAVVFPGGMPGATNLANCNDLKTFTQNCYNQNKKICAICASPAIVLNAYDLLKDHEWTCYPGMQTEASAEVQKNWIECRVVESGNLITSRGPGTTSDFAFTILEEFGLADIAEKLQQGMLYL